MEFTGVDKNKSPIYWNNNSQLKNDEKNKEEKTVEAVALSSISPVIPTPRKSLVHRITSGLDNLNKNIKKVLSVFVNYIKAFISSVDNFFFMMEAVGDIKNEAVKTCFKFCEDKPNDKIMLVDLKQEIENDLRDKVQPIGVLKDGNQMTYINMDWNSIKKMVTQEELSFLEPIFQTNLINSVLPDLIKKKVRELANKYKVKQDVHIELNWTKKPCFVVKDKPSEKNDNTSCTVSIYIVINIDGWRLMEASIALSCPPKEDCVNVYFSIDNP